MYLIIGCGYVGGRVAEMLSATARSVVAVTHTEASARRLESEKRVTVFVCDVGELREVERLRARLPEPPTAILHCASSSRGGAEMYEHVFVKGCANLVAAFPKTPIVFTSSTSVYPQIDGSVVTEESDATPGRRTSQTLRTAEDFILLHGGTVARLAGIYGPGRSFVLKNFLEQKASIEGHDSEGRWLNQIHREDAASALAGLMVRHCPGIFNVTDDTPMTQRAVYEALVQHFPAPMPLHVTVPFERKRAWTHKRVSNAKLRTTGWAPRYESYLVALDHDPALVPSILAQTCSPAHV